MNASEKGAREADTAMEFFFPGILRPSHKTKPSQSHQACKASNWSNMRKLRFTAVNILY